MPGPDPQLAAIAEPRLRALAARGTVRKYRRGTVLMEEGDAGSTLLVVLAGRLRAYSTDTATGEGREITYGVYGPGDLVGEMALDGGPRSASVITLDPATCVVLTRETVRAYIAEEPEFAFDLLTRVIARARRATHSARSLVMTDAYGRLCELLTGRAGPASGTEGVRRLPERMTHQEIAWQIGCSREMVSRLLSDLKAGGYIDLDEARHLLICKPLPARW